jgi:hypothetical protein
MQFAGNERDPLQIRAISGPGDDVIDQQFFPRAIGSGEMQSHPIAVFFHLVERSRAISRRPPSSP